LQLINNIIVIIYYKPIAKLLTAICNCLFKALEASLQEWKPFVPSTDLGRTMSHRTECSHFDKTVYRDHIQYIGLCVCTGYIYKTVVSTAASKIMDGIDFCTASYRMWGKKGVTETVWGHTEWGRQEEDT